MPIGHRPALLLPEPVDFKPNYSRTRQPLLPPTILTPLPLSGVPISTTGRPWGTANHRNVVGFLPPPASYLLGLILATSGHDSGFRHRRRDHSPATDLFNCCRAPPCRRAGVPPPAILTVFEHSRPKLWTIYLTV